MPDTGVVANPELEHHLRDYLHAIQAGDRRAAVDVALDAHESGVPAETVITDLLAAAQAEIGRGWQEGRWGVALEHRATAITEAALFGLMAVAVRDPAVPPEGASGRAAVACSEGEWHALPVRMMTDVLRLRGVEAAFVGPSLPAAELDEFLGTDPPPVVAVGCSLPESLPGAWKAITVLRRIGITVVAGGRGFGPHGRWSAAVGADHWAPTFSRGADVVLAAQSVEPPPPGRPSPVPESCVIELRHLQRTGDAVVERAVAEAVAAWPAVMSREQAVHATRSDLRSTLRTLTAAVLVQDADLVTDFVRWFEDVLAARQLPVAFVPSAFELLLHQLPPGLTQVRRMAEEGLVACVARPMPRG